MKRTPTVVSGHVEWNAEKFSSRIIVYIVKMFFILLEKGYLNRKLSTRFEYLNIEAAISSKKILVT